MSAEHGACCDITQGRQVIHRLLDKFFAVGHFPTFSHPFDSMIPMLQPITVQTEQDGVFNTERAGGGLKWMARGYLEQRSNSVTGNFFAA
ncbi:MAG: hypothetical protein V3S64_01150, partial [bacterium]